MLRKVMIGGLILLLVGVASVALVDLLRGDPVLAARGEPTGRAAGNLIGAGSGRGTAASDPLWGPGESGQGPGDQSQTPRRGQTTTTADDIDRSAAENEDLSLNAEEVASLQFMREEEKLARDIYLSFYSMWQMPVFDNIADSEQTHMDALGVLLSRYGLDDPAAGLAVGEFVNVDLQSLFDSLLEQGSHSLASALSVGAAIEEIDILDLQDALSTTDRQDIRQTYQNLTNGSENHLRAFVSILENQSEHYAPQYLDAQSYQEILDGGMAMGQGAAGQTSGRQGSGRGQRGGR